MSDPKTGSNGSNFRKMSDKRFKELEKKFNKQMDICQNLSDKIDSYRQVLRDGEIITKTEKDGTEIKRKISSFELAGYRKALDESRAKLKYEEKALTSIGKRYAEASRKNAKAAKEKIKSFTVHVKLVNMARTNSEKLVDATMTLVSNLESKQDPRFLALKETLTKSPASFNSALYKIVKTDLINEEYLKMLSASASIRAQISRDVVKKIFTK